MSELNWPDIKWPELKVPDDVNWPVVAAVVIPAAIGGYHLLKSIMGPEHLDNAGGLFNVFRSAWSIGFLKRFPGEVRRRIGDIFSKNMKAGVAARDAAVVALDGTKKSLLKDYVEVLPRGMPLIVNFGSSTWPFFWTNVDSINKLFNEYCDGSKPRAKCLTIYIQEAHPSDGWYLAGSAAEKEFGESIKTHRTIEDRLEMATKLLEGKGVLGDIVVDSMAGTADEIYGAYPERIYVLELDKQTGKPVVAFQGGRGPFLYSVDKLAEYLADRFQ